MSKRECKDYTEIERDIKIESDCKGFGDIQVYINDTKEIMTLSRYNPFYGYNDAFRFTFYELKNLFEKVFSREKLIENDQNNAEKQKF